LVDVDVTRGLLVFAEVPVLTDALGLGVILGLLLEDDDTLTDRDTLIDRDTETDRDPDRDTIADVDRVGREVSI
jgi:hypothetical protein